MLRENAIAWRCRQLPAAHARAVAHGRMNMPVLLNGFGVLVLGFRVGFLKGSIGV